MQEQSNVHEDNETDNFLLLETIVIVAAEKKSSDTIYFIKIINIEEGSLSSITNEHNNVIYAGQGYLINHFLEKINNSCEGYIHQIGLKKSFYFKETVLFFVLLKGTLHVKKNPQIQTDSLLSRL